MVYSIRNCPLPVIGKVNGNAFGGGAGLVAACDMSFALNTAKFGFTEVKLGLVPAVISPFVMEKIGKANCSRFFLTGERFGPEEAKRIGLIQDHFATESELDAIIDKLTAEIAASGPKAVKICKDLIQSVAKMDMHDLATKNFVTSVIAKVRISEEGQSGLNAFLNKGKPMWQK
jgi:methylglutaconyl-CoA hydratase